MLGTIADILGITSCVISVITFIFSHSLFKNMQRQKATYNNERLQIQTSLNALRTNIWDDKMDSLQIRSKLREALYSYFIKYWSISSPRCIYHLYKSIHYSKRPIKDTKKETLCISLDFLIAYLNKEEFKHE